MPHRNRNCTNWCMPPLQGVLCGDCLYMRYGENITEVQAKPDWVCPVCRDLCNCSFHRIKKGWAPTGTLYRRALAGGGLPARCVAGFPRLMQAATGICTTGRWLEHSDCAVYVVCCVGIKMWWALTDTFHCCASADVT